MNFLTRAPFRLLAIDPGLTIGYSIITFDEKSLKLKELVVAEERTLEAKAWGTSPMNILVGGVTAVVIEDFVGSGPLTKQAAYVLKQIGGFETVASSLKVPVTMQTNYMRKPFLKKGSEFFRKLKGRYACHHGKDALAHGLRWLKDHKEVDFTIWEE